MKAIIAINNLGFIGLDNKMLWHNKKDLLHFKKLTLNSTLMVGFRTATELPPLKNRKLVVLDRNKPIEDISKIDWCIGGKKTYEQFCHLFEELHISHIDNNNVGNVTSPNLTNLNPNCKIFNYYY